MCRIAWFALGLLYLACILISLGRQNAAPDKTSGNTAGRKASQPHGVRALLDHFLAVPEQELEPGYAEARVRELGSPRFAVREAAQKTLIRMSWRAAAVLRAARDDPDPERRRRVAVCLNAIREERTWYDDYDRLRELVDADPPGLNKALMHFLPFAADEDTETIVYLGVYEHCKKHPAERPALLRYLSDRRAARRALAALVLGRQGTPVEQTSSRKLLADPEPLVRLRAAQGLLAAHDKVAIPVLIELLRASPHPLDWEATELLHWAADCNNGICTNAMDRAGPSGVSLVERWRRWWSAVRGNYQWPSGAEPVQCPRLLLLTQAAGVVHPRHGHVSLRGGDGQPYWQFTTNGAGSAEMLPGGRVLFCGEGETAERDCAGHTLWSFRLKPKRGWLTSDFRREPDGTTTVVDGQGVFSLDERGRVIDGTRLKVPDGPWVEQTRASRRNQLIGRRLYLGLGTLDPKQLSLWDCDLARPERLRRRLLPIYDTRGYQLGPMCSRRDMVLPGDNPWELLEWDGYRPDLNRPADRRWQLDHPTPAAAADAWGDEVYWATWFRGSGLLVWRGRPYGERVVEVNGAGHAVWELYLGRNSAGVKPVARLLGLGFRDVDWNSYNFETVGTRLAQLRSPDAQSRRAGLLGLGVLRDRGVCIDGALPELVRHLGEKDDLLQGAVVALLREAGTKALPFLPAALVDTKPTARASAIALCKACGMPIASLTDALSSALKDQSSAVRESALLVVVSLGKEAAPLETPLRRLVQGAINRKQAGSAVYAAQALGAAAGKKQAVVQILRTALTSAKDPLLRRFAADGLGAAGADDRETVRALFAALRDKNCPELSPNAAEALGALGTNDKRLVPAMVALLQPSHGSRTAPFEKRAQAYAQAVSALTVLRKLGERAGESIPELMRLAEDTDVELFVRQEAIRALASMGGRGEKALAALAHTFGDADRLLEIQVEQTIQRLSGRK